MADKVLQLKLQRLVLVDQELWEEAEKPDYVSQYGDKAGLQVQLMPSDYQLGAVVPRGERTVMWVPVSALSELEAEAPETMPETETELVRPLPLPARLEKLIGFLGMVVVILYISTMIIFLTQVVLAGPRAIQILAGLVFLGIAGACRFAFLRLLRWPAWRSPGFIVPAILGGLLGALSFFGLLLTSWR